MLNEPLMIAALVAGLVAYGLIRGISEGLAWAAQFERRARLRQKPRRVRI